MESKIDHGIYIVEAYKIFRSKKFKESANFIETFLQKYKNIDDFYLNYLLILNYLHLGNFSRVQNIINSWKRTNPDNAALHEIEAYILLKGAPGIESPLLKYIECSEKFPFNKKFKSILSELRTCTDFQNFQKSVKLEDCTTIKKPEYRRSILNRKRAIRITRMYHLKKIIVILMGIFILFTFFFILFNKIISIPDKSNMTGKKVINSKYDGRLLDLEDIRYSLIDKKPDFEYMKYYTNESELKKDFISAQYRLKENHVNEALIILNSIYNSNANLAVKDKVVFLQNYISSIDPEERAASEIDIQLLLLNPAIYNGVLLDFEGVVYNLKHKDEKTIFSIKPADSIKNYYLEVYFDKNVKVEEEKKVKLTGIFINRVSDNGIYIQGINVK
ncbi:MAG: hypothetical protein JW982_05830 [Spirochaetes bacterium]|nr:hypothetical protein [Spirochaetota bacterium]